jgi:hypothetical protein
MYRYDVLDISMWIPYEVKWLNGYTKTRLYIYTWDLEKWQNFIYFGTYVDGDCK